MEKDLQAFQKDATQAEQKWLVSINNAAILIGKDTKIVASDVAFAAGEPWKGVEWCWNNDKCRDLAEQVGIAAVSIAITVAVAVAVA